jgi:hypothetical protein
MKKVLLFFVCCLAIGLTAANAQCHAAASAAASGKSCCASKMTSAAAKDATIEKRMDDNGTVSYVRREQDASTGNVRFVSVRFDEGTSTFVNVAPKSMTDEAKSGMVKKECSSEASKKACSGEGMSQGKACCAKKTATLP